LQVKTIVLLFHVRGWRWNRWDKAILLQINAIRIDGFGRWACRERI
jgi:hypothetical protein